MAGLTHETHLFKVLTHPTRLRILELLRDGEACVCHLEAALGQRQAYVSQQLAILRGAGLIVDRRQGWNIHYRVARPEVFAVLDAAQAALGQDPATARGAPRPIAGCPCPRCSPHADTGC